MIGAVIVLGSVDPAADIRTVPYAAILLGFCGATFDIVIDAYRIELLKPEQLDTAQACLNMDGGSAPPLPR